MLICMRTTLNLDDELMRQVRRHAADTGRTITQFIEAA
jgi:ribbon-helix-helix CopG family protein